MKTFLATIAVSATLGSPLAAFAQDLNLFADSGLNAADVSVLTEQELSKIQGAPGVLTLTVETPSGTVDPGTRVGLVVTPSVPNSGQRVWASVVTPPAAAQRNSQGYSRMPMPVTSLNRRPQPVFSPTALYSSRRFY